MTTGFCYPRHFVARSLYLFIVGNTDMSKTVCLLRQGLWQAYRALGREKAQAPRPNPATVLSTRELCPIKGFYDLTDFHSRTLNSVTAWVVFVLLS